MFKGVVYIAAGQVGEAAIGYVSGIAFIRYLYKVLQPKKIKAGARLIYNLAYLPLTLHSEGISGTFELLLISKLEKLWFGEPVCGLKRISY